MTLVYSKLSPFLATLVVLFFLGYPRLLSAQSTCPSAQDITSSLPFQIFDSFPTSLHAEVDFDLLHCSEDVGPQDSSTLGNGRWYQYNPTIDTIISFQMKEAEGSASYEIPNLLLFSGSCDSLQCIDLGSFGGLESESFLAQVDQGPFYFWIYCDSSWNDECGQTGQFVFNVVLEEEPTQLTCDTAENMTFPFESQDFFPSSLFADVDSDLQSCRDGVGPQNSSLLGPGRWYEYVPTRDTILTFAVQEDLGGSVLDHPNVLFFSGECDSLVCLDYSSGLNSTLQVAVDQGPYFFWLYCRFGYDGECSSSGNYVFTVTEHPIPTNDRIENATEIAPPLFLEDYTIVGAFSDFLDDPCALSGLVYGVYFQYTPVATELVTLTIDYSIMSIPFSYIGDPIVGIFTLNSDGTRQCLARESTTIDAIILSGGVTHYILVASPVPGAIDTISLSFQSLGFVPTEEPVSSPMVGAGPSVSSPSTLPAQDEEARDKTQAPGAGRGSP